MTKLPDCLTEEETLAFVDGEATAEVVHHVETCQACGGQARAQAGLQRALRRGLYRFDCPSPQAIGEYHLDLLEPAERADLARHVLECRECTAELASLRVFLTRDPPLPASALDRVKRVVAGLLTPPHGQLQPAARGAAGGAGARLYQAGELTIMFERQAEPSPGSASVVGMVLSTGKDGPPLAGGEVRLTTRDGVTHRQTLDDLGAFSFDNVPSGRGRFEVELSDQVLVVEELAVGEGPS